MGRGGPCSPSTSLKSGASAAMRNSLACRYSTFFSEIPLPETISAVQQGVVDGLEGTMDAYGVNGSSEVAKKMALTNHFLGTCGVYINADLFNSIPKEYQIIIQEEFTKGAAHMISEVSKNYNTAKAKLESQGITFNEVDHDAFAKAVAPVYANMKGTTPGIVDKFRAELAKMPKK